jgi:hypothetical protein
MVAITPRFTLLAVAVALGYVLMPPEPVSAAAVAAYPDLAARATTDSLVFPSAIKSNERPKSGGKKSKSSKSNQRSKNNNLGEMLNSTKRHESVRTCFSCLT